MADKQYSYDTTKYYSPTINEFYVGFEYETWTDADGWNSKTYELLDFVDWGYDGNTIESEPYGRVKLLDRQDIESFGFTVFGKGDKTFYIKTDTVYMIHLLGTKIVITKDITLHNKTDATINVFEGEIKNKSELQILLNQIGCKNK